MVAAFRNRSAAIPQPFCGTSAENKKAARGELTLAPRALAKCRYRPPKSRVSKQYSFATLERWYYAYRRGGLEALPPLVRAASMTHVLACPSASRHLDHTKMLGSSFTLP